MTFVTHDAPVRGVFVLLDGVRNEYPRANRWALEKGVLSVRRHMNQNAWEVFALFGRFDQVGYMGEQA